MKRAHRIAAAAFTVACAGGGVLLTSPPSGAAGPLAVPAGLGVKNFQCGTNAGVETCVAWYTNNAVGVSVESPYTGISELTTQNGVQFGTQFNEPSVPPNTVWSFDYFPNELNGTICAWGASNNIHSYACISGVS